LRTSNSGQREWLLKAFSLFLLTLVIWVVALITLSTADAGTLGLLVNLNSQLKASYGIDLLSDGMGPLKLSTIVDSLRDTDGTAGETPLDTLLNQPVPTATNGASGSNLPGPTSTNSQSSSPSSTPASTSTPTDPPSTPTPEPTDTADPTNGPKPTHTKKPPKHSSPTNTPGSPVLESEMYLKGRTAFSDAYTDIGVSG
jgi:hypothetical protein